MTPSCSQHVSIPAFIAMVQWCIFCLMLIHIVLTWRVLNDKAGAPSEIWHYFADIQSYTSVSLSRHRNENKFCFVIAIKAQSERTRTISLHSSARFLVSKSFDLERGEWHPRLSGRGSQGAWLAWYATIEPVRHPQVCCGVALKCEIY